MGCSPPPLLVTAAVVAALLLLLLHLGNFALQNFALIYWLCSGFYELGMIFGAVSWTRGREREREERASFPDWKSHLDLNFSLAVDSIGSSAGE